MIATLGDSLVFEIEHPDMRIIPTVTIKNPINGNAGSVSGYSSGAEFATEIMSITKDRSIVKVANGTPRTTYMVSYEISADV